ncbi:MAG: YchJ family protein [Micropruina sp.]
MTPDPERCPCGTGRPYAACCGPLHAGRPAATAEALMRSRYSAYTLGNEPYLLDTWHPRTRPETLDLDPRTSWLGLEIHATTGGSPFDSTGTVEFSAHFRTGRRRATLHEVSRFETHDGRWVYLTGTERR